jgi:hypothetical protein
LVQLFYKEIPQVPLRALKEVYKAAVATDSTVVARNFKSFILTGYRFQFTEKTRVVHNAHETEFPLKNKPQKKKKELGGKKRRQ